jgi:hypothetical protein
MEISEKFFPWYGNFQKRFSIAWKFLTQGAPAHASPVLSIVGRQIQERPSAAFGYSSKTLVGRRAAA